MKIIGITGGIGSGKSTVLAYMEETYHAYILQTDQIARKLQEPDQNCYKEITRLFGRKMAGSIAISLAIWYLRIMKS